MFETDVTLWGSAGLVLMLAEIIIPGGIIIFLGISAFLVAACLQFGLIDSWVHAFTLWFISSLVLLLLFRNLTQKMVGGDSNVANTDEEFDLFGKEVTVTDVIGPGNQMGRVQYQGTTWSALGDGSVIEAGTRAKIICRENISLVVEKLENQ
jgi:membrane protein implicated in regulation of membrane protease activity